MERRFSKKNVIILAILWLATNLLFLFGPWSSSELAELSGGKGIPDLMSYDLHKLQNLFAAYGPQGIDIYKNIQLIDFVYPLIYGALLLGILVRLKLPNSFTVLYASPFIIVFFDYSENLIIRHLINLYPNLTEAQSHLANLANICTTLKWANIGSLLISILGLWIWSRFRRT
jgi:hypothetical protein